MLFLGEERKLMEEEKDVIQAGDSRTSNGERSDLGCYGVLGKRVF